MILFCKDFAQFDEKGIMHYKDVCIVPHCVRIFTVSVSMHWCAVYRLHGRI